MTKKLISVLLAAIIVLSCCSTVFVAYAESANTAEIHANLLQLSEIATTAAERNCSQDAEPQPDSTVEDLKESYEALSENKSSMTSAQKAKLEEAGKMIAGFGKEFAGAVTSDEAIEQYGQILALLSDTAVNALSNVSESGAVAIFNALVKSYEGKVSVAAPTEEDLKGYNDILAAYEKLTDEQKGQVDLFMFDKMFHLILDHERQVSMQENPKIPSSDRQHDVNAENAAEKILGNVGYAAHFSEAKKLYTVLNDSKKTLDEKMEAFANATQYARAYADCWEPSYSGFYYKLASSNLGKSFFSLAKEYGKLYLAENPFVEIAPIVPEKPNAADYPKGESDPAYIESWSRYMAGSKAKAEYDCRKAVHTAACDIKGVKKVETTAPEFAGLADFMSAAVAAVQAFDKDSSQLSPAKEVYKTFGNMSTFLQAVVLNNTTMKVYCEPTKYPTYWSIDAKSAKDVYQRCADICQYDKLAAFEAVVKSITEPYNNSDIIKVKEAYDNISFGLWIFVPSEIKAKYKAILACVGPDDPSFAQPDLSIFKKTAVTYPKGVSRAQVEKMLPRVESLITDILLPILGVEDGLPALIQNKLYTNATIGEICKALFPMLANVNKMLTVKPSALAKELKEDKFQGAVAALKATGDKWDALTFANGNMGFQDGDKEGFLDAFAALFRPLSFIKLVLDFENKIDTTQGKYTYSAYEDFVPVFEALDLEGYMSSHEYTLYVKEVEGKDSNMAMDARVRPILVPIFNLIDQFANNPIDTLLTVLPKLGFVLKTDLVTKQLSALLSKFRLISITPPDLSAGALFDMIAPKLQNLDINGITISIQLNKDNFLKFVDEIGGCGNAVAKNSKIRGKAYNLGVEPDKSDTFIVLFRWFYGELTSSDNIKAIQTAVDASTLGSMPKALVKTALSAVSKLSADTALAALINLVALPLPNISGNLPGIHFPNISGTLPSIGGILPSLGDSLSKGFSTLFSGGKGSRSGDNGASNGGTTQTDDPSIPKTGGQIMTSLFALAAIAGLAGGAVLLKKKADADKD